MRKRLGDRLTGSHLQFLEGVIVADPARRQTAKAALSTPWLRDVQIPRSVASAAAKSSAQTLPGGRPPRPGSQHTPREHSTISLPPQPEKQLKPRVVRSISLSSARLPKSSSGYASGAGHFSSNAIAGSSSHTSTPRNEKVMTPVGMSQERRDVNTSTPDIHDSIDDLCEESICEEIGDGSFQGKSPTKPFIPAESPVRISSADSRSRSSPPCLELKPLVQPKKRVRPPSGSGKVSRSTLTPMP